MLAGSNGVGSAEKAFDMTYGWQYKDLWNDIAKGKKSAKDLDAYWTGEEKTIIRILSHAAYHESRFEQLGGTEFERLGAGVETFLVLSNIMPGMPLLYSGQRGWKQ